MVLYLPCYRIWDQNIFIQALSPSVTIMLNQGISKLESKEHGKGDPALNHRIATACNGSLHYIQISTGVDRPNILVLLIKGYSFFLNHQSRHVVQVSKTGNQHHQFPLFAAIG